MSGFRTTSLKLYTARDLKALCRMKGIKGVAEALRLEIFPMDIHGVDYAVGDMTIESPSGEQLFVRDISDQFHENEFRTPEEVVAEILRVIESRPESRIHRKQAA